MMQVQRHDTSASGHIVTIVWTDEHTVSHRVSGGSCTSNGYTSNGIGNQLRCCFRQKTSLVAAVFRQAECVLGSSVDWPMEHEVRHDGLTCISGLAAMHSCRGLPCPFFSRRRGCLNRQAALLEFVGSPKTGCCEHADPKPEHHSERDSSYQPGISDLSAFLRGSPLIRGDL